MKVGLTELAQHQGFFLSGTYQLDEETRKRNGRITLHQMNVFLHYSQ